MQRTLFRARFLAKRKERRGESWGGVGGGLQNRQQITEKLSSLTTAAATRRKRQLAWSGLVWSGLSWTKHLSHIKLAGCTEREKEEKEAKGQPRRRNAHRMLGNTLDWLFASTKFAWN